ncbi:UNVERIFIED_CONTAM: variable surface lipoprotein [Campylobacter lari]
MKKITKNKLFLLGSVVTSAATLPMVAATTNTESNSSVSAADANQPVANPKEGSNTSSESTTKPATSENRNSEENKQDTKETSISDSKTNVFLAAIIFTSLIAVALLIATICLLFK